MKNCVTNRVHLMSRVTGVAAASAAVSSVTSSVVSVVSSSVVSVVSSSVVPVIMSVASSVVPVVSSSVVPVVSSSVISVVVSVASSVVPVVMSVASSVVPVVSSSLIPSSVVPLIPSSVVSSLRIRVRRSSWHSRRTTRRHSWHSWHSRSSRNSRNSRGRRLTRTPTILLIQTTQHTAQLPLRQPPITHLIVYTLVDGVLRVLVQNHKAALIITLFTHTHSRNLVQRGSITHRRSARTIGSRLNDGTIRKTHTNGTAAQENAVQLRGRLRSSTRLEFDKTKASTRIGLQTHAFLGHLC